MNLFLAPNRQERILRVISNSGTLPLFRTTVDTLIRLQNWANLLYVPMDYYLLKAASSAMRRLN